MIKKFMLIVVLFFSPIALFQTKALAGTGCKSGWGCGFGWGSYQTTLVIAWGQKPGTTTTYIASDLFIPENGAKLACENNGMFDVRGGLGGTSVYSFSPVIPAINDIINGRTTYKSLPFCATVGEPIYEQPIADPPVVDHICTLEEFNSTWDIDLNEKNPCRNNNWTPFQYMIQKVVFEGTVYKDCETPGDLTSCAEAFSATLNCETKEDTRVIWPGPDGDVTYICVDAGSPIAWEDSYSVRINRTLSVRVPGVLNNDSDFDSPDLSVAEVNGNSANVGIEIITSIGKLKLNADGSFTYTSTGGTGLDTFNYKATDGAHISNEATLTITVY